MAVRPRSWQPRGLQGWLERFNASEAGKFWDRLSTVDFLNSSLAFAALAIVAVFPLFAVGSSVLGGDLRNSIIERMGLNPEATRDVERLIASGDQAIAALTWFSAIVLVLGGIGMASTLSTWYLRMYDLPAPKGMTKHFAYHIAGVGAALVYIAVQVEILSAARGTGGHALVFLATFVTATLFWWLSTYMLIYRQLPLLEVLPAGIATGACLTGLGIVSAFFFSGQIVQGERSYGPAGVVIALVNFLIGFGVCLHAGVIFGRVWNEWRDERAARGS